MSENGFLKDLPIKFTPDLGTSTLKALLEFSKKLNKLHADFPNVSLKQVRDYLEGHGDLPEEVRERVDDMNKRRKRFIKHQLSYARDEAEKEGLEIPEKYLTGDVLDVFFAPKTYRFYDFAIYYYYSWYEPWEMAALLSGPLFSI